METKPRRDRVSEMVELRREEIERLQEVARAFPKRRRGVDYTQAQQAAIIEEVLERLEQGESMHYICDDEHMPCPKTVGKWITLSAEWGERYEALSIPRARALFELALYEVQRATDREAMYIAEKRAGAYLKAAALLNPKVYSDKTHSALAKTGPTQPIAITLNIGGQAQEHRGELTVLAQPEDGDLP